jgi:hypothetical protein
MTSDHHGGFLIEVPGLTTEQITEALNATCPECGASCGTHFPKCSLETREPIKIDLSPRQLGVDNPDADGFYWLDDQVGRHVVKVYGFDQSLAIEPRYVQFGWPDGEFEPISGVVGRWYRIWEPAK